MVNLNRVLRRKKKMAKEPCKNTYLMEKNAPPLVILEARKKGYEISRAFPQNPHADLNIKKPSPF